ncbi:unnamed protein product, partial [Candidula unifasciata]
LPGTSCKTPAMRPCYTRPCYTRPCCTRPYCTRICCTRPCCTRLCCTPPCCTWLKTSKRPDYLTDFKNPCWYVTSHSPAVKKLRCLPYFHIIGVDKSGTTDLWFRVSAHPDILKPAAILDKETHWWSWRRFEILHFDWYLQNFDPPAEKINQTVSRLGNRTYHHLIGRRSFPHPTLYQTSHARCQTHCHI